MRFTIVFFMALLTCTISVGQASITPEDLLQKSIEYHDPKGKLFSSPLTLDLIETRPNGVDRKTSLHCHISQERFTSSQIKEDVSIVSSYDKGEVSFKVNGSSDVSEEDIKTHRLNEKRFLMMRSYYQYLWLLPGKLLDEGTHLDPVVQEADFFGKASLQMKVTYDPAVGNDIWYFYFHPETYALIGYRFYHDEAANDGEYILLEGETSGGNIRLPKQRKWYMHKDDKYLGADILDKLTVGK